jgi:lipopolysaccharide cholinephosphotransferase
MVIEQDTLYRLRKVMLELLDKFVQICEENNLTYFLTAGTLLGAVRHKGFIPWDDDIDIAMPRNDYEKFLDIFENNNLTDYYLLSNRCPINTFFHYKAYAKLCKKGTVFAENNVRDPKNYSGIFIDIWPFDNCVRFLVPLQTKFIAFALKLYLLKTHEDVPQSRIKRVLSKIICCFVLLQFSKTLLRKSYSLFNRFKTKYISFFSGLYGYKRETHKYNTVFPLAKLSFEGNYYYVPGKWDVFLTELYGDYMKLPPVEQQKAHDVKFISFGDDRVE